MVVVTTNILVKLLPSLVSLPKVKKRVLLQLGELVYYGELRRQRIDREVTAKEQGVVVFMSVVRHQSTMPSSYIMNNE